MCASLLSHHSGRITMPLSKSQKINLGISHVFIQLQCWIISWSYYIIFLACLWMDSNASAATQPETSWADQALDSTSEPARLQLWLHVHTSWQLWLNHGSFRQLHMDMFAKLMRSYGEDGDQQRKKKLPTVGLNQNDYKYVESEWVQDITSMSKRSTLFPRVCTCNLATSCQSRPCQVLGKAFVALSKKLAMAFRPQGPWEHLR